MTAHVEIIAELAQGFEGQPLLARLLVRGAIAAGVDAVKLQLIYADEIATPDYEYYDLYRRLEMPEPEWARIASDVKAAGLAFYLDVSGSRSVAEAKTIGADGVKVSTSNFFNEPLVEAALTDFPRVFLGVGGITVDEIEAFITRHDVLPGGPVQFLFGLQAEPTPLAATNLAKLGALQARFPGHSFGYMDHAEGGTEDSELLALLTLPFRPSCIEKHLSLDRALRLEDFVSALDPSEMSTFVRRVRKMEAGLGSGMLDLSPQEQAYRLSKVKVVVAGQDVPAGSTLSAQDLCLRRVGRLDGPGFYLISDVAGRTTARSLAVGTAITDDMLI